MRVRFHGLRHSVVLLALGAAGCSSEIMNKDAWFTKPLHTFETPSFMASSSSGPPRTARAITPEDYVDASGYCAAAAQASVPAADGAPAPETGAPTIVGGIALGMTECEVVQRAGRPERVDIGAEAGARVVVLTYPVGERAGIYRFSAGRLQTMDRVAEVPKPVKPARPAPRKKPANRPA